MTFLVAMARSSFPHQLKVRVIGLSTVPVDSPPAVEVEPPDPQAAANNIVPAAKAATAKRRRERDVCWVGLGICETSSFPSADVVSDSGGSWSRRTGVERNGIHSMRSIAR
jgi:hypothetical protein